MTSKGRLTEIHLNKKSQADSKNEKLLSSSLGAGKVRAMFDERRRFTGIDKSFLLEPLSVASNKPSSNTIRETPKNLKLEKNKQIYSKVTIPPLENRQEKVMKGQVKTNERFHENKTIKAMPSKVLPQVRDKSESLKPIRSAQSRPQSNSVEEEQKDIQVPDGFTQCRICKRNFVDDRIATHQVICEKSKVKKRKVYDASKKRVQGTESESFVKHARPVKAAVSSPTAKNSSWRSKHEDFIKTIRAAKKMQAHLDGGGKLSDLPPPPPSENLDYIQCQWCNRRFNQGAAERHIPLCKNMQHNKPKPKQTTPVMNKFIPNKRRQ